MNLPRAEPFKPENYISLERRIEMAAEQLRHEADAAKFKTPDPIFTQPVPAPMAPRSVREIPPDVTQRFSFAAAGVASAALNATVTGLALAYAVFTP